MKTCTRCGKYKPRDSFHRLAKSSDGYRSACKQCRQVESAENHVTNRDRINACSAAWRRANRERHLELIRRWTRENIDSKRMAGKLYRDANRQAMRDRDKTPERREHNRQNAIIQNAKRRAVAGAVVRPVTALEWAAIVASYCGMCVYCYARPVKLTMDHIQPLVRGGDHSVSNLAPACKSCNSAKNSKTLLRYLVDKRLAGAHVG